MREHRGLWRGKCLDDNGEWVEGYLIRPLFDESRAYIGTLFAVDDHDIDVVEVAPETLGECAGVPDKNKKLIFEGDIVTLTLELKSDAIILPQHYRGKVEWSCGLSGFFVEIYGEHIQLAGYLCKHLNVIGNVHDNPELLKGESNEMQKLF